MPCAPEKTGRKMRTGASAICEKDTYSIAEFCQRHGISQQLYFKERLKGGMPHEFRVGVRVLISKESAAAWRRKREAASA